VSELNRPASLDEWKLASPYDGERDICVTCHEEIGERGICACGDAVEPAQEHETRTGRRGRSSPTAAQRPVPPHANDAETSLLGGVLVHGGEGFAEVAKIICPEDFYWDSHAKVFEAMSALHRVGHPIDRVMLKDALTKRGDLEAAGGEDYIDSLGLVVPATANLLYYAKIVAEKALVRRLIETCTALARLGSEHHGEAEEFADLCEKQIRLARQGGGDGRSGGGHDA